MLSREKLVEIEKWFLDYVNMFEQNPKIHDAVELKKLHCLRVRDNMVDIARSENLSDSDLYMAEVIGLLHDIGRFRQYREYKTFADHRSLNHGAFGVKVLLEEGILNSLLPEDKKFIFFAIGHHNGASLPEGAEGKAVFFGKMIRDADKLDILEIVLDQYRKIKTGEHIKSVMLELADSDEVSQDVLEDLHKREIIKKEHLHTVSDFKLLQIGWVFDMHFLHTFVKVKQRNLLFDIYNEIPKKSKELEVIFQDILQYLDEKIAVLK